MKSVLAFILNLFVIIPNFIVYEFDNNFFTAPEPGSPTVTVVSANVRCIAPEDTGEKNWFRRAPLLIENLRSAEPDVICFQEVTSIHYRYLKKMLKGYDDVIRFRDMTPIFSEGCPVFYSTKKFDLVDKGSFWLSETPERMSKDWGSDRYRISSYAVLSQKSDGKQFAIFSTHLDHVSDEARINGINVMLEKAKEFGNMPIVFAGDFNTSERGKAYIAATQLLDDAKYRTDDTDSGATYQNFGNSPDHAPLDYFMISKTGISVEQFRIIRTTYDGVYPSDHYQIMMKMTLD